MTPSEDRGFALLAALWLMVVVSLLLVDFGLESRVRRLTASNAVADLRARAAADAGIQWALARLRAFHRQKERLAVEDSVTLPDGWHPFIKRLSQPQHRELPDSTRFEVSVKDEGAALPLNAATESELERLLLAVRTSRRRARIVAQSILDWRDGDGLHRPEGAEWADHYRHLSTPVRPRNGSFGSVEELKWVRGVTASLLARLRPHVSVSGGDRVNLNTASPAVLASLPGLSREAEKLIIQRRRRAPLRNLLELEEHLRPPSRELLLRRFAALASRVSFVPRRLRITSVAHASGSPVQVTVEALVVRDGDGVNVVWTRHYR